MNIIGVREQSLNMASGLPRFADVSKWEIYPSLM